LINKNIKNAQVWKDIKNYKDDINVKTKIERMNSASLKRQKTENLKRAKNIFHLKKWDIF